MTDLLRASESCASAVASLVLSFLLPPVPLVVAVSAGGVVKEPAAGVVENVGTFRRGNEMI
jgi:hypothetical protein